MKDNRKYTVVIIGAGNIGAFFDVPGSQKILSHANAFTKHKGFRLLGFVDIDAQKAKEASSVWGVKAFLSIEDAFWNNEIDIVSIAVPDKFHYTIFKKVSKYPVRLIFLEKPIAKTMEEGKKIAAICKEKKIPVCVNYTRRFVPELEKIRNNIINGNYGKFLTGSGYYGKGILHNGSHSIDLLRYYLGEISDVCVLEKTYDFLLDDPSVSVLLKLKNNAYFHLHNIDCKNFSIFEMDFIFEKRRIRIKDSGFRTEEFTVKNSPIFKDYRYMVEIDEKNTSLGKALYYVADNIYNYLQNKADLKCSLTDGYRALQICSTIIEKSKKI